MLSDISHSGVGLGQLVLDAIKGTQGSGSIVAVVGVTISLSPGQEPDRSCTGIGLSNGINKSLGIWQDVIVHIPCTKTWSLGLILDDNSIPISTSGITFYLHGLFIA